MKWIAIAVSAFFVVDLLREPEHQWSTRVMVKAIETYQQTASPYTGIRCKFEPTCSHYGAAVIRSDGAVIGGARTLWRVLRCGPWTKAGTIDQP